MASYKLLKEIGDHGEIQGSTCTLRIEGGRTASIDVESALYKLNSLSPRSRSGFRDLTPPTATAASSARLASLDVFRGLTVAIMILVDNAGGIIPAINHSPWNGLTLADVVMPFFLFMVGVSLGLAYKNMSSKVAASKKAICRAVKLFILGIFLQGGYFHSINNLTYGVDMEKIRWMGILQRIAVAYFVAAICEIWLRSEEKVNTSFSLLKKYQRHWAVMLFLTTLYLLLIYGVYVPDWEFQIPNEVSSGAQIFKVNCGIRGNTGPACNSVGMIDRTFLGIQHLYSRRPIYARTEQCSINSPDYGPLPLNSPSWCQAPFEPEGLLSTVMAIVSCLVGLQYGHSIVHFKDHKSRILMWLASSSGFIVFGILCDILGMHINKPLYSFSYMCVTTGLAGMLFVVIYIVVDVYGFRSFAQMLEWMGMHALLIFILVACNVLPLFLQGFYWKEPHNNIFKLIGIGKGG